MKHVPYLVTVLGVGSVLSVLMNTQPAQAQVAYGSYVGVGPTVGVTDGSQVGGVIAFRYKLLESPISFRAQALVGRSTAIVPTVSYDVPLNWQTDAYLGAGVVFANGDTPSPVGNKISFALQPGIDYMVPNSNTVIFGNAIIAFDGYRDGGGTAVSVQGGLGLRF
ncbi:MAG: hypothetical protein HEQ19_28620 [Gloeotrichia echinulata CP02]|jgi:hypothetical protein|nr:hypothetical protein [Gloeotrichia echinulata DEX184]